MSYNNLGLGNSKNFGNKMWELDSHLTKGNQSVKIYTQVYEPYTAVLVRKFLNGCCIFERIYPLHKFNLVEYVYSLVLSGWKHPDNKWMYINYFSKGVKQ